MRRAGLTLIEFVVSLAIVGVLIGIGVVSLEGYGDAESARSSARAVAAALDLARGEATRTGNVQLLFAGTDIAGNALTDSQGNVVPLLVLDDGRPGSANQNCMIDAGEDVTPIRLESGVSFGVNAATAAVPTDEGPGDFTTGSSFNDTDGNPATWVLFLPNGVPRAANAACDIGNLGSGGGAFYVQNGARDISIVLSPLGSTRIYTWAGPPGPGEWR